MKILSADQLRLADAATISEQEIDSAMLMERAACAFTNWFLSEFGNIFSSATVVCGTGNNGGDGLCIARQLYLKGFAVTVFIVRTEKEKKGSEDFEKNLLRLQKLNFKRIKEFTPGEIIPSGNTHCIIDCIFGTGVNRAAEGIYKGAIDSINASGSTVISVDVPSGLFCDAPTTGSCVHADFTFTLHAPKLAFFIPENEQYTGRWQCANIGLSSAFIAELKCDYFLPETEEISLLLKQRETFSHKGTYGHAFIIAGKPGMAGAATLCGRSCLVTGAGLVTLNGNLHSDAFPELMSLADDEIFDKIAEGKFSAIGIGPGLGTGEATAAILEKLFAVKNLRLVIDADGLNTISEKKELLQQLPAGTILTPHPKEYERLFGKSGNEWERMQQQKEISVRYQCTIVYKRAWSVITTPQGKTFFNSTGNPGMATAGSGDVLTGIITSFSAQGYEPEIAAVAGTYLHGLAGDIAMETTGGMNLTASDIIENIQHAFAVLIQV